jgi:hypothetical protein
MINLDLTLRTPAEELWLSRKAIGRTQAGHAAWLGVSRSSLQASELYGPVPMLDGLWTPVKAPGANLLLALARRRSGLGLKGAARVIGVCHVTVFNWELKGDQRLIDFWEKQSFTFA